MSENKTEVKAADAVVPVKKGPGRPRKHVLKPPPQKVGLLKEPTTSDNLVELIYDKPGIFKKICSYWSSLNSDKIHFVFTQKNMTLYTKNYKESNTVGINFDGSKMNQYYCPQDLKISVSFANLELIMQKLDKIYESISFVIQKKHQKRRLDIILQNEFNMPEYFKVDIIMDDTTSADTFRDWFTDPVPYALEFKLPGKYFKKMISDTKQFDKQWTIEKYGVDGNLTFKYKSGNGQVDATVVPKNTKEMGLKSSVSAKEIFSVSVYVDNIKPTSSAQLADTVLVRAAKDRALWISAELDENAITLNVLINIVDLRNTPLQEAKAT